MVIAKTLLSGRDFWHTNEVASHGLGAVRFSDGPNGVRGQDWVNGTRSSAIPCATALGASFDVELVDRLAQLLADECKRKGVHALLAPTMNIHRYALCGRNFESFSEDPFLTGRIASAYVKGLQKHNIAACPKHFLANEAENGRRWSDSMIEERALREIYLEPFRMVVKDSDPWCLMTAYNSVNGTFCSESDSLISILRNEWRFKGVVISDWFGTYSSAPALKAGLDLEMPGPTKFRTMEILQGTLESKEITEKQLCDSAGRIIKFLERTERIGTPGSVQPTQDSELKYLDSPQKRDLLREATRSSIVLLRNNHRTLPLSEDAEGIFVFGEHAKHPTLFGGGSASLRVPETASPWDCISRKFPSATFVNGIRTDRLVQTPRASNLPIESITLDWYNGDSPAPDRLIKSENITDSLYMLVEDAPEGLLDRTDFCTTMRFDFRPTESGSYEVSLCGPGDALCQVNGETVFEVKRDLDVSTEDFLFNRSNIEVCLAEPPFLRGGENYQFKISSWSSKHKAINVNREFFIQGCRFGLAPISHDDETLKNLALKAQQAKVAIIFVGTGPEWESEGFDRINMLLPGRQNEMIERVAKACNGPTIVVLNCGSPVDTSPWIKHVDAVVQMWFPGMGAGEGLLDILTGKFSPCARLPTTFWDNVDDYPAGNVQNKMTPEKEIFYEEGLFVGYRASGRAAPRPRYAFGCGLSYTKFNYDATISQEIHGELGSGQELRVIVDITVRNTGSVAACETVLLFLRPLSPTIEKSTIELKAFAKTPIIPPHESANVSLCLYKQSFAHWSANSHRWEVESDTYEILFAGPLGVGDWKFTEPLNVTIAKPLFWKD
ncbi:glycoside hydrolase family 3 protein [Periconia macrospinosa]|uniref:beta-glucosidase n=1 Tax=Periconia macrospinosa TaxID=97972 RepID=A0A2V1DLJ7_9PLEO|nr:glycoside hydrolase family 3 protein [Periconia macrospinosa]